MSRENGNDNYWSFSLRAYDRITEEFPDIDPRANELILFLNRASGQLTATLEKEVHQPLGLSWSTYRFLFVLWIAGDLQPNRIAELTLTSRGLVSSIATTLLEAGLVDRRPSQTDGRSVDLSLTDEGRRTVREAFLAQNKRQAQMLQNLTDAEQEILRILLKKLMVPHSPES